MEAIRRYSFDHIYVFTTVIDEGGFSAAARKLNRTQSAITYAIAKLENQVGTALFNRDEYRPILTEAGRILLPLARSIVDEFQMFADRAQRLASGLEAELSFVVNPLFPAKILTTALQDFRERYPHMHTRMHSELERDAQSLIAEGACSFGLVTISNDTLPLTYDPIAAAQLVLVVGASHRLAKANGPVPKSSLARELQYELTGCLERHRRPPRAYFSTITYKAPDLQTVHMMVRNGTGFAPLPLDMVADDIANGKLVVITPEGERNARDHLHVPLLVAKPKHRALGPATQWFVDHLQTLAQPSAGRADSPKVVSLKTA